MKRMKDNPMNYYTVKAEDLIDIVPYEEGVFIYTPSPEFVEVIHNFESALRIDWFEVYESFAHQVGTRFTVLYPINKPFLNDDGDVGYAYFGDKIDSRAIRVWFYDVDGTYFIKFLS